MTSTVASARALDIETTATAAPAAPNCSATARPIAPPAPVTKATLPTNGPAEFTPANIVVGVSAAPASYLYGGDHVVQPGAACRSPLTSRALGPSPSPFRVRYASVRDRGPLGREHSRPGVRP